MRPVTRFRVDGRRSLLRIMVNHVAQASQDVNMRNGAVDLVLPHMPANV